MSERLAKALNKVIAEQGKNGRTRLARVAQRSEQMIERYRKGICCPDTHVAFKLALACEFKPEEALQIAEECSSYKGRKSA